MLKRLERMISNIASRCVIAAVATKDKCQMLGIELVAGDPKENIEHLEPYGFTAVPHAGAEGLAVFPDGDRSHGIVIVAADRRYRLKGLKGGEVAIYSDEGDSVVFNRGRVVNVVTETLNISAATAVNIDTPILTCTGNVKSLKEISDKTGSMDKMRGTHNDHDHNEHDGYITLKANQKME
jgi:phage baseplate assembly protein V